MSPDSTPLVDNRFLLLELLGRGGMGRVYRAFDRVDERMVALKLAQCDRRSGPGHPLAEEYRAWSRLDHPNVVQAFELGTARRGPLPAGTPYLVLESFRGVPAQRALPAGRATTSDLEQLARRVLCGLAHVHDAGLVHRDLKPSNVLVDPTGSATRGVKLTDFGLAIESGRAGEPGRVSGSFLFVSPEALLGRPLDGRADLYGLGIMLFLMATGRPPVCTRQPTEVLEWHLSGPEADPLAHRPQLGGRLARFIRRLAIRDPQGRPTCSRKALQLLGHTTFYPAHPRRPPVPASTRGALRSALDAVRLGSWRRYRLPRQPAAAETARRELATLCDLHDVTFARIGPGSRPEGHTLTRVVLRLLLKRGDPIRALVRRHGLRNGLPLALFGGLPVWDRMRSGSSPGDGDLPAVARGVAGFIAEFAGRHSLVLVFEPSSLADPLTRAVARELTSCLHRHGDRPARGGGLLLVLPPRRGARHPGGANRSRVAAARGCG